MVSPSVFTDIVHRDLKLENILVEKSVGDDSGRINIKVRCKDKRTQSPTAPLSLWRRSSRSRVLLNSNQPSPSIRSVRLALVA